MSRCKICNWCPNTDGGPPRSFSYDAEICGICYEIGVESLKEFGMDEKKEKYFCPHCLIEYKNIDEAFELCGCK